MALGAMLVAGSAVPAAAKSQVDFNGMYRTYMYGVWNSTFTEKDMDTYDSDFFLVDRLQLDFGFHATDEVSVYWRLRAPAKQRWGQYTDSSSIMSRYFYGELKQDWGTLSVGRLKDGYSDLGLASLGYAPDGPDVNATYMGVFDFDDAMSGIRYANRTDSGFQLAAAIFRPKSMRTTSAPVYYWYDDTSATWFSRPDPNGGLHDETSDFFVIEPAYFWDGGAASFGIQYLRDHVQQDTPELPAYKEYAINPAFMQSFGDFSIHFEGKAGWGKAPNVEDPSKEDKSSGYAVYLDGDYNYGPGNIALAAWWAAGPDTNNTDSSKAKGTVGMGQAFAPLIVAYGANGNGWWYGPWDKELNPKSGPVTAIQMANLASGPISAPEQLDANHWAIDLNGAHAFTDDLTFTYSIAYLNLNKVREGKKKNIGYEADLGLQIQLLDNLHLGTTLGYLKVGDALKQEVVLVDSTGAVVGIGEMKPKDAYSWFTTLTFSF